MQYPLSAAAGSVKPHKRQKKRETDTIGKGKENRTFFTESSFEQSRLIQNPSVLSG
jgi:hypothetical protein